jgi:O-antigen ligase
MTLNPALRLRLTAIAAAATAVWLGFQLAQGDMFWPIVCAGLVGAAVLSRVQPVSLSTLLLGLVAAGYIAGNRGFAQMSLSGTLPLLPAEFVLLVSGAIFLMQCAWRRELPFKPDALNFTLLLWFAFGLMRIFFDVRQFGVSALRDFATVYYAAFFFLAQNAARSPEARRFLVRCILIASGFVLIAYPFFLSFPDFFWRYLAVRGISIIIYKGDLVGTMLAFSAVIFFARYEASRRWQELALCLALLAGALATNNRSSMVGLGVATLWLALAGRWRFAFIQVLAAIVAVVLILFAAYATNTSWQKTPLYGFYERVTSIVDPMGERTYESEESVSKGDNNLFRAVWWQRVFDETVNENPYTGLGFGYDLAADFVREYYPDPASEFTTRSPHNILLTVFGRMGLMGLLPFLAFVGACGMRTWRAVRSGDADSWGFWCAIWVIFVSACFGVVLEGPMGAVVFWTALGIANAASGSSPEPTPAPHLPDAAPMDQLAPTS